MKNRFFGKKYEVRDSPCIVKDEKREARSKQLKYALAKLSCRLKSWDMEELTDIILCAFYENGEDDIENIQIQVDDLDLLILNEIKYYLKKEEIKEMHHSHWLEFVQKERNKIEHTKEEPLINTQDIQKDIEIYLENIQIGR